MCLVRRGGKGDPKKILEFLKSIEPLSDEEAKKMTAELEKGRKRAIQRKTLIESPSIFAFQSASVKKPREP